MTPLAGREKATIALMSVVAVALALAIVQSTVWGSFFVAFIVLLTAVTILGRAYGNGAVYFLLFVNLFATDLGLLRETSGEGRLSIQALLKMAVYLATTLFCLGLVASGRFEKNVGIVFLYVGLCLASTLYSVDPWFTFSAVCVLLSQIILAMALVMTYHSNEDAQRCLHVVVVSLAVKVFASWLVAAVFPSLGFVESQGVAPRDYGFGGLDRFWGLAGPNITGLNAALLAAIAFPLALRTKRPLFRNHHTYLTLAGVLTVVATQSRTSVLAAAVAMALSVWFLRRKTVLLLLVPALLLVVWYLDFGTQDMLTMWSRTGSKQEVITIAGRTRIWGAVLEKVRESPLLGYGYGSGRIIIGDLVFPQISRSFRSGHNVLLESLINVGVPGTLLLLWIILATLRRLFRLVARSPQGSPDRTYVVGMLSLATVMLVNGFTESGVAGVQTVQGVLVFWLFATSGWLLGQVRTAASPERLVKPIAPEQSVRWT